MVGEKSHTLFSNLSNLPLLTNAIFHTPYCLLILLKLHKLFLIDFHPVQMIFLKHLPSGRKSKLMNNSLLYRHFCLNFSPVQQCSCSILQLQIYLFVTLILCFIFLPPSPRRYYHAIVFSLKKRTLSVLLLSQPTAVTAASALA